ncbi:MAG TPA: hypothetical protein PL048_16400 [Leptospiraceae bacterium]|nr:hypothetical protein [Leptospiraceae bacterium]HMY68906.1 hypothetical protein [Leptospiraceae bacterium]HMZ60360.1 hypothetical protein [Leptospiraceae bacterium]HNF14985.1 hypothetical protein [Leptospiraceae bacterium]HNM03011.1 hypothetical protein [Leptospiraceae bacterium]
MDTKKDIKSLFLILLCFFCLGIAAEENRSNAEYLEENSKIVNDKRERAGALEKEGKDRREEPDFMTNGRKENFFVAGFSAGSPAGLNFNAGWYFDRFVIRGSGMSYNSNWNGAQLDLGYSFYKTKEVIMGFSLVGGAFRANPFDPQTGSGGQNKYKRFDFPGYENQPPTLTDNLIRSYIASQNSDLAALLEYKYRTRQYGKFSQNYIGLTYDVYLDGFFLQLGAGYGQGSYRNPQLLIQVGYLFDFGKSQK